MVWMVWIPGFSFIRLRNYLWHNRLSAHAPIQYQPCLHPLLGSQMRWFFACYTGRYAIGTGNTEYRIIYICDASTPAKRS